MLSALSRIGGGNRARPEPLCDRSLSLYLSSFGMSFFFGARHALRHHGIARDARARGAVGAPGEVVGRAALHATTRTSSATRPHAHTCSWKIALCLEKKERGLNLSRAHNAPRGLVVGHVADATRGPR